MSNEGGVGLPPDLLPGSVPRLLNRDLSSPFASDLDYFDAIVACESARKRAFNLSVASRAVFKPSSDDYARPESTFFENGRDLRKTLQDLVRKLERKVQQILDHHNETRPIVEIFLDAMEASDEERKLFRCVLVAASGALREMDTQDFQIPIYEESSVGFISSIEAFQQCESMTIGQFLKITSSESKWVKEQLYNRIDILGDSNLACLSNSVVRILIGFPVTTEKQFQQIESSRLQHCLETHRPLPPSVTGGAHNTDREAIEKHTANALLPEEIDGNGELLDVEAELAELGNDNGNLFRIIGEIQEKERLAAETKQEDDEIRSDDNEHDDCEEAFGAYRTELEFLDDQFRLIKKQAKLQNLVAKVSEEDVDEEEAFKNYDHITSMKLRTMSTEEWREKITRDAEKLRVRVKKLEKHISARLLSSKREKNMVPRFEQIFEILRLGDFDRFVVLSLVAATIKPDPKSGSVLRNMSMENSVEYFLSSYTSSLEVSVRCRKSFYKSSPLIKEGILFISGQDFSSDLNKCLIGIDRRFVDYICGVDMELSEMVDGSHLYTPTESLDDVVLPAETKKRILDSAINFDAVKEKYKELKIDEKITYGMGQILLFYGSSGTGKTMMANAIAARLKKKVLLVNFPTLGLNEAGSIIKILFREARIKNAVLFFDECESLFRSRDNGESSVNTCLSELERMEDLCILATNMAHQIDEAMLRRISVAVEFKKPDHILREKIWRNLKPDLLAVDDDVSFADLARKFELSGGFIKNVWLNAISLMTNQNKCSVSAADLEQAARDQVVGSLRKDDLDRNIVPTCGIDSVVASDEITRSLKSIVDHKKAQSVLFSQWGFDKLHRSKTGVSALFCGDPGTGKTMAAEAISFDLGVHLMVVNSAEVVNKYVGQTGKNISALFKDAQQKGSVLVFDEGEGLFGSRGTGSSSSVSRHDNLNVGLLLQQIESFAGVCIVITNHATAIDDAFFRRFDYVLQFTKPSSRERERLWESILPKECPLGPKVSLPTLANRFELSGGDIKSALFRAASRAALRSNENDRILRMQDLEEACQEELKKRSEGRGYGGMYI